MRKTKIICTLGPSTDKDGVLRELVANGMNVARFNFSHGSYEEHKGRLDMLKAIRAELNKPVAALLDTKCRCRCRTRLQSWASRFLA